MTYLVCDALQLFFEKGFLSKYYGLDNFTPQKHMNQKNNKYMNCFSDFGGLVENSNIRVVLNNVVRDAVDTQQVDSVFSLDFHR